MTIDVVEQLVVATDGLVQPWDGDRYERHASDWSGLKDSEGPPLGIAFPRSTTEVAAVVRACTERHLAVVPQGGLTGLAGGAVPCAGSVILSLERMTRIEEVDPAGSLIVVEAGVPLQRVQEAALEAGLLFPLDLGARGSALIGGVLATNAGGNRALRYGVARDLTLGLEAVTADGTIIDAMNRMPKNNSGYDLKQLFIGSEGTLGIITRAVLKLHPSPRTQIAALCALADYNAVLALLSLARDRMRGTLSAFEVMWSDFFAVATADTLRVPFAGESPPFVVLVEAMGSDAAADDTQFQAFVEAAFETGIVADALLSQNQRDVEDFWAIRDSSGELAQRFGPTVNFDVSVPVADLATFAEECRAQLAEAVPTSRMLTFGHIADGNIHFACLDAEGLDRHAIEEAIYGVVARWRGAITAEHGVGLEKRSYLSASRSIEYISTMRTLKTALDPDNRLNPGKVLVM